MCGCKVICMCKTLGTLTTATISTEAGFQYTASLAFQSTEHQSGFPKFQRSFISIGRYKISVRMLAQTNGSFVCHLHQVF